MRDINKNGTYTIETLHYELSVEYTYYYSSGTYEYPPEEELEIVSVELNGMEITDFFWEFIEDKVYEQVLEYAREH